MERSRNMLLKAIVLAIIATVAQALLNLPHIIRPCSLRDYKCIRDNLAVNFRCNQAVRGAVPRQYRVQEFKYDTPYFNATYVDHGLIIRNLHSCFISEFYFNRITDVLVLSLDCPNLNFESNRDLIQHYSKTEDSFFNYNINGTYPLIRLTTNIPQSKGKGICTSFVFADVTALPIFHIDPNDRPTRNFLSTDLSQLNIYERETFFYRGPSLFRYFINSVICDFGCN